MESSSHDYWAKRAVEEASLAQQASAPEAAYAHREMAKAYRARADLLAATPEAPLRPSMEVG
jgi:hypothetical protein